MAAYRKILTEADVSTRLAVNSNSLGDFFPAFPTGQYDQQLVAEDENGKNWKFVLRRRDEGRYAKPVITQATWLPFVVDKQAEVGDEVVFSKPAGSHGLFMMSPNRWDPLSRSLSRPLHLSNPLDSTDIPSVSVDVTICQPQQDPHSLRIEVRISASGSAPSLSQEQQDALLAQVKRMLRLSEADERNVRDFKRIVRQVAQEEGEESQYMKDFSGRVFRSPTLFEDMVKCMLLCNCQWPRTLNMARALCELQWELQHCSLSISEDFIPKTPVGKESKQKQKVSKVVSKLTSRIAESKASSEDDMNLKLDCAGVLEENVQPSFPRNDIESDLHGLNELSTIDPPSACDRIGNFPSPRELANLDESFLAKRCNLGYRAGRILKLARGIVDGQIQLRELEDMCNEASLTTYDKLAEQLSQINGFGPFTCNNVLVCIGFYHVIPTDSETIRHLKQVHARNCTSKTVQMIAESIYGKYAPFQFLAYWSELWHFYEKRFGKLSEMPYSDYKLITASNMGIKNIPKVKRTKIF